MRGPLQASDFLLFLLGRLGGGIFGGDMNSGDAGGIGSVSECWLTGGSICGGFGVGTWQRKNLCFLRKIFPDLVLT